MDIRRRYTQGYKQIFHFNELEKEIREICHWDTLNTLKNKKKKKDGGIDLKWKGVGGGVVVKLFNVHFN